jgi:hypothetical protein
VGIPKTDETTKNALCQENSTFRNPFTIDDFGLEKQNNMDKISLGSGSTPGEGLRALILIAHPPNPCKGTRRKLHYLPVKSNRWIIYRKVSIMAFAGIQILLLLLSQRSKLRLGEESCLIRFTPAFP